MKSRLPLKRVCGYLQYWFLEIGNNTTEPFMRGIDIGRKTYMLVGSERGPRSEALVLLSFLGGVVSAMLLFSALVL